MSRSLRIAWVAWAASVAGSVLVARLPDDPGSIPVRWLVVLAVLGTFAAVRGSRVAWVALVMLNVLLLGSLLLLAPPIGWQLSLFYALALLALGSLIAVAVVESRTRRTALAG